MFSFFSRKPRSSTQTTSSGSTEREGDQLSTPTIPEAKRKILVLDLDETLLRATTYPPNYPHERVSIYHQGKLNLYFVAKRPGLEKFIKETSRKFTILVYTSSQKPYANAMVEFLGMKEIVKEVFHRDHCYPLPNDGFVKQLSVIKRNLRDVIFLDDSEVQTRNNSLNSLKISPFLGETDDTELEQVLPLLLRLAEEADVRPVYPKVRKFLNMERDINVDQLPRSSSLEQRKESQYLQTVEKCRQKIREMIVEESLGTDISDVDEFSQPSDVPVFDCGSLKLFNNKTQKSSIKIQSKLSTLLSSSSKNQKISIEQL